MEIGIIGQGFVGTAIKEVFKDFHNIHAYDKFNKDKSISTNSKDINSLEDVVKKSDIIFICVPTPMKMSTKECDTSIVEEVVFEVDKISKDLNKKSIMILKSTVPPGTILSLNQQIENFIAFSPEFLTEANAINDFKNQNRIILGIDYIEYIDPIYEAFYKVFGDNVDYIVLSSKEAEMVKYTTNTFLATKVSFFNDIYSLCEKLNIDYDNVLKATLLDKRINESHTKVPGPDGDRGFGGHCFPKDLNALLAVADNLQITVPTLMGANITNEIVRTNKDWLEMKDRAVSDK